MAGRRAIVMSLAVATTFTVTTIPLQTAVYVLIYVDRATATKLVIYFRTLAMLNACVNPVIYVLLWRPFRVALTQVLIFAFTRLWIETRTHMHAHAHCECVDEFLRACIMYF